MDEPHFPLNYIIQNAPHLFLRSKILVWNAYPGLKCKCKAASSQQVQRSSQVSVEPTAPFYWFPSSQVFMVIGLRCGPEFHWISYVVAGFHMNVSLIWRDLGIARGEWNWTEFMLREREPLLKYLLGDSLFRTTYTVFFHRDCFWAVELETNTSARNFSVAERV